MNTAQAISGNSFAAGSLFSESPVRTNYLWKNLVIEKRISLNWLGKMYEGSVLDAFWTVLSSPNKLNRIKTRNAH